MHIAVRLMKGDWIFIRRALIGNKGIFMKLLMLEAVSKLKTNLRQCSINLERQGFWSILLYKRLNFLNIILVSCLLFRMISDDMDKPYSIRRRQG
jgi:hypothetical protein